MMLYEKILSKKYHLLEKG